MNDIEKLSDRLRSSGKEEQLRRIADSPDGRAVGELLDADAVSRAARDGDMAALGNILRGVLSTEEGRRLADTLQKAMQ